VVHIVAAKEGVSSRREDFIESSADGKHAQVEGASSEVEYSDALINVAPMTIGEGSGGWLVQDTQDVES
jgi:hypothetical protein